MKKALIMYALLLLYIFVNAVVIDSSSIPFYNEIVNPVIWIVICTVAVMLSRDTTLRVKDENNKTQSLIIILIIYIIIYFLLGLLFGFQKTPYSKDIFSILKNIWSFGGIIFFQEIVRASMIKLEKKKYINFIMIVILFVGVNLSFNNFSENFSSVKDTFICDKWGTNLFIIYWWSTITNYISIVCCFTGVYRTYNA